MHLLNLLPDVSHHAQLQLAPEKKDFHWPTFRCHDLGTLSATHTALARKSVLLHVKLPDMLGPCWSFVNLGPQMRGLRSSLSLTCDEPNLRVSKLSVYSVLCLAKSSSLVFLPHGRRKAADASQTPLYMCKCCIIAPEAARQAHASQAINHAARKIGL